MQNKKSSDNIKTSWNFKLLFDDDSSVEIEKERKETETLISKFVAKWKNNSDYLKDPSVLKKALDEYEEIMAKHGILSKVGFYFFLRSDTDMENPSVKAKSNKYKEIAKKLANDIQFFELNISKIPLSDQNKILKHKDIAEYRHFLERRFRSGKYMLSEKEEAILNLKQETSHQKWEDLVQTLIFKSEREVIDESGKKKMKNLSEVLSLLSSKKKETRDSASVAVNDVFKNNLDIAEAEMNAILANKKIDDELRGLERPDTSRFLDDDVDAQIVDTLVNSVSERFDIAKRYYKLKAQLMGLKKLEYHERNVPYGKIESNYDFNKSVKIVEKVFANLDKEFLNIYLRMLENGQVDVFPKKGKRGGGYCAGDGRVTPTYILLNHDNRLNDVGVLAHEFGHAINRELMLQKLNSLNIDTPKSTAEVASIFMEDFVFQELLKEANEEDRLSILMSKLNDEINSVIRQTAFYNFEKELHADFRKKGYLSKEEIGKLFHKHMFSYMGDYVEQSKGSENWWIHVPHFRYFFYVYSYSMGALISKALQMNVRKNPAFISKVKEFLSSGRIDSPKNLFLKLGIDITKRDFWNTGLDEIESLLNETEKLAKKLGKI